MATTDVCVRKLTAFEYVGMPSQVKESFPSFHIDRVVPKQVYMSRYVRPYLQGFEDGHYFTLNLKPEYKIKPLWSATFEEYEVQHGQSPNFLDFFDVYGFQLVYAQDLDSFHDLPLLTVARWREERLAYITVLQAIQAGYALSFGLLPIYEQVLYLAGLDATYVENGKLYCAKTGEPLDVEQVLEVFRS